MIIEVKRVGDNDFIVDVEVNGYRTKHNVHLDDTYYEKLTAKKVTKEELIKNSFEFLLERESNSSILREFDLKVIQRYFPEYERLIKNWKK